MNLKQQQSRQRRQDKHRRKRRAEVRQDQYNADDIRRVAAHEAGHAVAALAFGFRLESVDVQGHQFPGGIASVGSTRARLPVPDDLEGMGAEAALPLMTQMMAGPVAEAQVGPKSKLKVDRHHPRFGEDASGTVSVAICCLEPSDLVEAHVGECLALCRRAEAEAHRFVAANRAAIEAVAAALIAKSSLTGDEVAALVAAAQG